jgi:plasmid stability protein
MTAKKKERPPTMPRRKLAASAAIHDLVAESATVLEATPPNSSAAHPADTEMHPLDGLLTDVLVDAAPAEAPAPPEKAPTSEVLSADATPPSDMAPVDVPNDVPPDTEAIETARFAKRKSAAEAQVNALLARIAGHGFSADYPQACAEARELLLLALSVEQRPCSACGHAQPRLTRTEAEARELEIQAKVLARAYSDACTARDTARIEPPPARPKTLRTLIGEQAAQPALRLVPPTPLKPSGPNRAQRRRASKSTRTAKSQSA